MVRLDGLSLNQAVIKGKMEQKVETAKALLSKGQSTGDVSSATGLNEFAVSKLESSC